MSLLCFFGQSPCLLENHSPVSSQCSFDEINHIFLPGSPLGSAQTVHCTTGEQRFLMFLIRARGQFLLIEVYHNDVEDVKLVKLRNPWGDSHEWNGDWCDNSSKWKSHPTIATELNHSDFPDGLFWMTWDDFTHTFNDIQVCVKRMDEKMGKQ